MKPNFIPRVKLRLINFIVYFENFLLDTLTKTLFVKEEVSPGNILVYKVGNIGDIICAVPAIIAIRRHYPRAKLTLLTSPGRRGSIGAKELLTGAWYLDGLIVYYLEDVKTSSPKLELVKSLRKNQFDLFIQLPDDLAKFRTMIRNVFFAKMIGVRSALGFKIRTIQLFKKTQVDYSIQETETESLLNLLKQSGIKADKAEFEFSISDEEKNRVKELIKGWGLKKGDVIVALGPGGKRETNRWPANRFNDVSRYLFRKYNTKIIILGGQDDIHRAEIIGRGLPSNSFFTAAGKLNFKETLELLRYCKLVISNSTGTIHLAAAAGLPTIGLYSIRDILGRWFPYGIKHKIIFHKFLDCDYRSEACIKKSIDLISVEEVIAAADDFAKKEFDLT